jgi:hypothetical protein
LTETERLNKAVDEEIQTENAKIVETESAKIAETENTLNE